jgi:hypothetical protein
MEGTMALKNATMETKMPTMDAQVAKLTRAGIVL